MQSKASKILLVDDEELVRSLLARLLIHSGYEVEEADNGYSGLQAARRFDGALGLIVTDIDMPVMDGLQFAAALRKTDRELPILFITGLDPSLIYQSNIQASVLAKPFTPDAFLELVSRLLRGIPGRGLLM
jgi:CheY-like chemotaxis protein